MENFSIHISPINDSNDSDVVVMDVDHYGTIETLIFGIWLTAIILFSISGNALVMLVILFDRGMRSAENGTNLFLFYLALSDLMTGIFVVPISLYTLIHEQWDFGDFLCSLNSFFNTLFLLTSIHILMYISIHKYLTVKRLSECDTLPVTKRTCHIMIGASWLWGLVFAFLTTVGLSKAVYKVKTMQCGPRYPEFTPKSVSLSLSNFVINLIIPFVIMLIMYLKIYFTMKETTKFRRQSTRRDSELRRTSGEKAAIHTMVIVLTCFIVCWLPYVCYTNYVFFTANRDTIPAILNPLAYCFGFTNSACNPIIYAFRFPDFKDGYLKIIRKIYCCRNNNSYATHSDHMGVKETIDLVKSEPT